MQDTKETHRVKSLFVKLLKKIVEENERRMDALKKIKDLQDFVETKSSIGRTDIDEAVEPSELRYCDIFILLDDGVTSNPVLVDLKTFSKVYRRIKERNKKNRLLNEIFLPVEVDHNDIKFNSNVHNSESEDDMSNEVIENAAESDDFEVEMNAMSDNKETKDDTFVDLRRASWMRTCNKKAAKVCRRACKNAQRNFCRVYSCSRRAKRRFRRECKISCNAKFRKDRYSDTE